MDANAPCLPVWSASAVEQILSDPVNLKFFKEFCIEEMSVENLLFCLEVHDFKTVEAPSYRKSLARKIFRKYIRVDAPMGIAVQDRTRKEVSELWEVGHSATDIKNDLFDKLAAEVRISMKLDILPRFIESKQFAELAALKFEERKVCRSRQRAASGERRRN